jgi:hypothetical protein
MWRRAWSTEGETHAIANTWPKRSAEVCGLVTELASFKNDDGDTFVDYEIATHAFPTPIVRNVPRPKVVVIFPTVAYCSATL